MTEKELLALALEEDPQTPEIISLADSLYPLRQHFNRHQDFPRFLALLSPTCKECVEGARAIKKSIVTTYPQAPISLSIVWINMLQGDDIAAAKRAARIISDPRVRHFYDPQRLAGKTIAHILGGSGKVAWDIYLFYSKVVEWKETPPQPLVWVHQLTESRWADAEHYHTGPDLITALSAAAQGILFRSWSNP